MVLLVIETSSATPGLAWRDAQGGIFSKRISAGRGCASRLVVELAALRRDGFLPDLIVVGCGPGSYSGIRGGICAGTGFARAVGARIVGVCSLFGLEVPEDRFEAVGDAGRGMLYVANVDRGPAKFEWRLAPRPADGMPPTTGGLPVYYLPQTAGETPPPAAAPGARRLLEFYVERQGKLGNGAVQPIYLQGAVAGPAI